MKQVVSYASGEKCDEKKLFHMRHIPRHIEKKKFIHMRPLHKQIQKENGLELPRSCLSHVHKFELCKF